MCGLELQSECKAGNVFVLQQNWFSGLVHELQVVVIVSQEPVLVCKQLRKTVIMPIYIRSDYFFSVHVSMFCISYIYILLIYNSKYVFLSGLCFLSTL